jgi:gentisate 1,2-dioxygenase
MAVAAKIASESEISPELREAIKAARMVPLWESPTAHKLDTLREPPHIWRWADTRRILTEVGQIMSPRVVERRVLSLVNPKQRLAEGEATTGAISAAMQLLKPSERARPHRHSMNALRFVLEGSGAETLVDGKPCPMEVGDLVITPAWCWHEHVNNGIQPTLWLDVLDVALHLFLGTDAFQPGSVNDKPTYLDDEMFQIANVTPVIEGEQQRAHSPVFRYPWRDAKAGVAAAPAGRDGLKRVRYVNPMTGGACMAMLDCYLIEVDSREFSLPFHASYSTVCSVVQGIGKTRIGDKEISWAEKDTFTLPFDSWVSHASDGPAYLFLVTNRDLYARLDLLTEEWRE